MNALECNRCTAKIFPASMFVASVADKDGNTFAHLTRKLSPGLQWALRTFTYFRYSERTP